MAIESDSPTESSLGVLMMQSQAPASTPQRIELTIQTPPSGASPGWLATATALAWPLAVIVVVLVLRQAIVDALKGISARAKSLSFGFVAFELGATSAPALTAAALDDIRDTARHAPVADSSAGLASSLSGDGTAECTIIDIGQGDAWITSRLYVVATFVARMRGVRLAVFTASGPYGQQFLGFATIDHVRSALARAYPWLELAHLQAWNNLFAGLNPQQVESSQMPYRDGGPLDPWRASQLLDAYKRTIQQQGAQAPPGHGWVALQGGIWERAEWLTPDLLSQLLGNDFIGTSVQYDFDTSDEELGRRVLRFSHDFVPIVDRSNVFQRLISRADYVARTLKRVADNR